MSTAENAEEKRTSIKKIMNDEIAELRVGLFEETMISAIHTILGIQAKNSGTNLRTAVMASATEKVAVSYQQRGFFP